MSWLNYHHLFYFYHIAKDSSISEASKRLNLTQSSLSSQLKSLEESIGVKLFDRVGRRLVLSDKGKHVFGIAQKIFDLGGQLINEVENNQLGVQDKHFKVGAVSSLSKNIQQMFFAPLIHRKQKLDIDSSDLKSLLTKLRDLKIDIIITNNLPDELEDKFVTHKIHSFPYCLVSSRPLKRKELEEKMKNDGVCTPKSSPYGKSIINSYLERYGNPSELVKAEIEDTALLRLFAVDEEQLVLIPKIGVYKDLLKERLYVLDTIENINESFFIIARSESFELMNIDILINNFNSLIFKGDKL